MLKYSVVSRKSAKCQCNDNVQHDKHKRGLVFHCLIYNSPPSNRFCTSNVWWYDYNLFEIFNGWTLMSLHLIIMAHYKIQFEFNKLLKNRLIISKSSLTMWILTFADYYDMQKHAIHGNKLKCKTKALFGCDRKCVKRLKFYSRSIGANVMVRKALFTPITQIEKHESKSHIAFAVRIHSKCSALLLHAKFKY